MWPYSFVWSVANLVNQVSNVRLDMWDIIS